MNSPIIEVNGISKQYVLSHQLPYQTFRDALTELVSKPSQFLKRKAKQHEDFWALRDINFTVQRGEAIGLIGANGSGKSTLLKILSQITSPTAGEIKLRGRVASLLEVGTGFHPELTGRENIFLNGAILGMTQKEINSKFDEIVAFSGVEKFLDTPVKRYSSGMHVRLAFSVAAHLEPEILLVDEVLAVGDAEFQKKCLGKMDEVTKGTGRTIIFVSHNMEAIKKLCTRSILLKNGQIVANGNTNDVIEQYLARGQTASAIPVAERKDRDGQGDVKFTNIALSNNQGRETIKSGDGLRIDLSYTSKYDQPIKNVRVVATVSNDDLRPVLRLDSDVTAQSFDGGLQPNGSIRCETGPLYLGEGRYFVEIDFLINGKSSDHVLMADEFTIEPNLSLVNYRIPPDRTITNTLIAFEFSQRPV